MPTATRTKTQIMREALERFRMGMYATRGNALHGTHSCPCVTCIAREALAAADEAPLVVNDEATRLLLGTVLNNATDMPLLRGHILIDAAGDVIEALNARGSK